MEKKVKQDRIKVIARIRPLNQKEILKNDQRIIQTSLGQCIQIDNIGSLLPRKFLLDSVLEENATQEEVFSNVIQLLESYIDGYNCTIFTYGQTGTGKTFTMLGYDIWEMVSIADNSEKVLTDIARDEANMGVVPRSMKWLLNTLNKMQSSFSMAISYVELYNDIKIIDLLNMNDVNKPSLEIRENKRGDIIVPGLTRIEVTNIDQVLQLLWDGAKCRSVAATDMNDHSSRSHTIFIVYLQILTTSNSGIKETKSSKLCLVDLAGSEKWKSHQMATFSEARIKELTSINRSLSALGNCISALLKSGRGHVPYRDSKLTRLLQDSLGGNTKTLFIVTISPSMSSLEETTSTLQFADRAMKVQVVATPNTTIASNSGNMQYYEMEIQKYQQEVNRLKLLLQNLLQHSPHHENTDSSEKIVPRLAKEIQQLDPKNQIIRESDIDSENYFDFNASVSQELLDLKEENLKLIEELYQTQQELKLSQEEKRMILAAIYEDSSFSLEREYCQNSDDTNSVERIKLIFDSTDEKAEKGASVSMLQMRLLTLQQEELERKRELLEETDVIQEERWKWLQQYHSWLQTQSTPLNNSMSIDEQLYNRVCLMEASILVQADELQRTKKLFLQTNQNLQQELKDATAELDELYAEKGTLLERIQLLEDEIDKLSNGSLDQTVIHSPSKRHTHHNRPSYIPVRIRPTSSAQNRLRFAKGSKPPEPSSAPPQKKPPEPSVPPPPSVIQGTIKASGWSNQEIDVFSNQFSPQKFLDSLRFTHLGDNLEYLTPSQKISSQPNSLLSSNLKSEIPRTTAMIQENSPSPSLSSGSTSTCEEWQTAENSRVQSRRKIMSPSSAFFPVPELNKPTTSKGASERAVKKESKKVNQRNDFASSNDSSSHQQEPSLMVNGGVDLDAILARANHIVDRHKSFEETENQRASTEWVDEVDSTPSFTSSGVWKMIQDPQSERFYYYNQYTHECTWERPTEDEIEAVSQAFDTSYHGDHSSEEMHEEALVSTQLIHQTQLPPIEEVEEENIEVSTDNLASLDNKSPKSSFASAALRHLQRSIHIETEETGVGKDEGSGEINVAAALALADAILLKRNIVTLELEKQTEESSMMPPSSGDDERGKKNKATKKPKKLWRCLEDPTTKQMYYHNRATGETTWNRPTDEELELLFNS